MPAQDALDPGPDGSFPFWPRNDDGSTDEQRMPRGPRPVRMPDGSWSVLDPAPGLPDGTYAGPPEPVRGQRSAERVNATQPSWKVRPGDRGTGVGDH